VKYDLFISYDSADAKYAEELRQRFEKASLSCFLAPKSIEIGKDFPSELRDALLSSKAMCFLATPNSLDSPWVMTELGLK